METNRVVFSRIKDDSFILPNLDVRMDEASSPVSSSGRRLLKAEDALARGIRQAELLAAMPLEESHLVDSTEFYRDQIRKFKMKFEDGSEYETTVLDTDFAHLPKLGDRVELVEEWYSANQAGRSWFLLRNLTTGATSLFFGKSIALKIELKGQDILNIDDVQFKPNEETLFANFSLNGLRMNVEVFSNKMQHYYNGMPLIDQKKYEKEESPDGKKFRIRATYLHPIEKKTIIAVSDWLFVSNRVTIEGRDLAVRNRPRDDFQWPPRGINDGYGPKFGPGYPNLNDPYFGGSNLDFKVVFSDEEIPLTFRGVWPYLDRRGKDKERSKMLDRYHLQDTLQILSSKQKDARTWIYSIKNLRTNELQDFEGPLFWMDWNSFC